MTAEAMYTYTYIIYILHKKYRYVDVIKIKKRNINLDIMVADSADKLLKLYNYKVKHIHTYNTFLNLL